MRSLIAIESCQRDVALNAAQRETWANPGSPPADHDIRFFYGMTESVEEAASFGIEPEVEDCVYLAVRDDYFSLSVKTRAICRWALAREYEFLHIIDSDAYVRPELLTATEDYTGLLARETKYGPYLWGAFYSLSKRAMEFVANTRHLPSPYEDVCTGIIMQGACIKPTIDPSRFLLKKVGGHAARNWTDIPENFSAVAELNVKEMQRFHANVLAGTVQKMKSGPIRIGL